MRIDDMDIDDRKMVFAYLYSDILGLDAGDQASHLFREYGRLPRKLDPLDHSSRERQDPCIGELVSQTAAQRSRVFRILNGLNRFILKMTSLAAPLVIAGFLGFSILGILVIEFGAQSWLLAFPSIVLGATFAILASGTVVTALQLRCAQDGDLLALIRDDTPVIATDLAYVPGEAKAWTFARVGSVGQMLCRKLLLEYRPDRVFSLSRLFLFFVAAGYLCGVTPTVDEKPGLRSLCIDILEKLYAYRRESPWLRYMLGFYCLESGDCASARQWFFSLSPGATCYLEAQASLRFIDFLEGA